MAPTDASTEALVQIITQGQSMATMEAFEKVPTEDVIVAPTQTLLQFPREAPAELRPELSQATSQFQSETLTEAPTVAPTSQDSTTFPI